MEPPLWLQNEENAAMAHLSMFYTGRTGSFSQKRLKWAWFQPKSGHGIKITCALHN